MNDIPIKKPALRKRDVLIAGIALTATVVIMLAIDIVRLLGVASIEHRGFISFIIAATATYSLKVFTPIHTLEH